MAVFQRICSSLERTSTVGRILSNSIHATEKSLWNKESMWQTSLSILRNWHSHPRLQQPPPPNQIVTSMLIKTLLPSKSLLSWKPEWCLAYFSNKVFLINVFTLVFQTNYTFNRLLYSLKITFMCNGKPKYSFDSFFLWYPFYSGGLELNTKCFQGMPAF